MSNITFKSIGATCVALIKVGSPYTTTIQYSKNGGAWSNVQFGTAISLSNNDTVSFSGNARFSKNIQNKYNFTTLGGGTLAVSGDLISLVSASTIEDDYEFNSLFKDCKNIVDASNLTLASNTTNWCYTNMFFGCQKLSAAPIFVATDIKQWAYANMFVKCTALIQPPTLPRARLYDHACSNMFQNCTNLTGVPNLYASGGASWMYNAMFENCKNVNIISAFPSIAGTPYSGMFCNTFRGCENITTSPRFGFTKLPLNSLNFLFDRAKNLSCYHTDFDQWPYNGEEATSCFLKDVSPTGVFVCTKALSEHIVLNQHLFPDQFPPQDWTIYKYETMPLTFRVIEPNKTATIKFVKRYNDTLTGTVNLQCMKNYSQVWTNFPPGTSIELKPGQTLSVMNTTSSFSESTYKNPYAYYKFETSGAGLQVFGNIQSLVNYDTTMRHQCLFGYLFEGDANITNAKYLYLPVSGSNIHHGCYEYMFANCTGLQVGPQVLPATTIYERSYSHMFYNCPRLYSVPILCGTYMHDGGYASMFYGCSNLKNITVCLTTWQSWDHPTTNIPTEYWVDGVALTGTFTKPSTLSTTYGISYIPQGWNVVNK